MLTKEQMTKSMDRRDKLDIFESEEARRLFRLYCDMLDIIDEMRNDGKLGTDTLGTLKAHALRDAASIIHDEFMLAEYGAK